MKILLVEDDEILTDVLTTALTEQHYIVDAVADGLSGWNYAQETSYDLILMDVGLPRQDGISLCRRLRSQGCQVPILLITAKEDSGDRIAGLDAGADDYLTKPLNLEELQARVRALLRRGSESKNPVFEVGNLQLDPRSCQVTYDGRSLNLTPKEYNLLELFLRNPARVFSRGQLVEHLWTFDDPPLEESVKAHVKGLRQKLKAAGAVDWIENIYGIGYRLNPPQEAAAETTPATAAASPGIAGTASPTLEQAFNQAKLGLWQKHQGLISDRLSLLQQVAAALPAGNLSPQLRQDAAQAAHKLAGILGMYDLDHGTVIARTIEVILQTPTPLTFAAQRQLIDNVQALESLLAAPRIELPGLAQPLPDRPNWGEVGQQFPAVNVLVVDDDPAFLDHLCLMLEPWGIRPTGINNPQEIWSILPTIQPDLLILDVEMPQTSGVDLCQAIRHHPQWQSLPIIFLTGHSDRQTIQQVFAVGADDFVNKPVVVPELLTRIINRLERTRLIQSLASKDPLTGLPNQLESSRRLEAQLPKLEVLSLVVFRLPDLRQINLEQGHGTGHQVLQRWGSLFQAHFAGDEIIGYWGNGEFIVGLPNCDRATARDRLGQVLIALRQQVYTAPEGERFQVNSQWAIAEYPTAGQTLRSLYRAAIQLGSFQQ
ncbi:MAG: response regulator [Aphanocapsa sp. GSE-SYN-MK-11-07L]|jgi:diguanylate cyclase (GGDEF)-like protein|nr:response regulator [Aphanocapsa sp. GSE-SYN-MK-11-07L]